METSGAIESSLVGLIGAGLAVLAEGCGIEVTESQVHDGAGLVAFLAVRDGTAMASCVERTASQVWRAVRSERLHAREMSASLDALKCLLAAERIDDQNVAVAIAEAQAIRRHGGVPRIVAQRLAADIVSRAEAGGSQARSGVQAGVAERLLQSLFTGLLAEPRVLISNRAHIAQWGRRASAGNVVIADIGTSTARRASGPSGADPAQAEGAGLLAAARRICEATGLPQEALKAIIAASFARGLKDSEILHRLEEQVVDALELMGEVAEASRDVGSDDDLEALLGSVLGLLRAGDFAEANRLLGEATRHLEQSVHRDRGADGARTMARACRLRILGARIDEFRGAWLSAAYGWESAARALPHDDRIGRWKLMVSRAIALYRQGEATGDVNALLEAVGVFAQAGRLVAERDCPIEWAKAHVALGQTLLVLGRLEDKPERFLAAALHFKPAVDVLSRERCLDHWASAQVGLADALRCQGSCQGDVVVLEEAAFAYRAALGVMSKERSARDWLRATVHLGETLVRIGEEAGERACLEDALAPLRTALSVLADEPASVLSTTAQAALGRALASLASETLDAHQLGQAAELIQGALRSGRGVFRPGELARLESRLGDVLWALATGSSDEEQLLAAAEQKFSALERLEALAESGEADAVRADLAALDRLISGSEPAAQPARA